MQQVSIEERNGTVTNRLIEKIDEVKRSVAEGHSDLSPFMVHLWISLAFAMKSKPPYNIELNRDLCKFDL